MKRCLSPHQTMSLRRVCAVLLAAHIIAPSASWAQSAAGAAPTVPTVPAAPAATPGRAATAPATPPANRPANPPATAAAAAEGDLLYRVVPGDTLEGVARRLMEEPRRYREVGRMNQLKNDDLINPGQTIRIPAPYLRMQAEDATVTAVKGSASISGRAAEVGGRAAAESDIVTGADGQMTLKLADGSEIRVQPGTAARLAEVKRNPASGARAYLINLLRGRLETDVTPSKSANSRFTINTPTAALGVRGTSFRATAEGNSASTEVLEGRVAAIGTRGGAGVEVNRGFGTKAEAGKAPLPPVPLLDAPGLQGLSPVADQSDPELTFAAVPGAARYRGIVAEDARFERVVAEAVNTTPSVKAAALADGQYFFRARAIDPQGLEGWNADSRFRVRTNPRPPQVTSAAPGGALQQPSLARMELVFRWEPVADAAGGYTLQIASDRQFTTDVREIKVAVTRHPVVFDASPQRTVYWRVRSLDAAGEPGPAGPVQAFEMGVSAR